MTLSEQTIAKIHEEISHYPNPRGALISALHMARREKGSLSTEVYADLAPIFRMRVIEVAEVASFYSLFRQAPAEAVIQVCTNVPCCIRGARKIVRDLEQRLGIKAGTSTKDGRFGIQEVECLGSCSTAPVIQVNDSPYLENVTAEVVAEITSSPEAARKARRPPPMMSWIPEGVEGYLLPPDGQKWLTQADYQQNGGYQAIQQAMKMSPKDLAELVKSANLRGRGGAGFNTGMKWTFMPPKDDRPRYLAVNADESEPGTFKDREIMERNPHLFLEGIMIACHGIQADAAYIYIRGEYVDAFRIMKEAIAENYRTGVFGESARFMARRFDVHIQPGAGAYICGEESGMLESMEGKKGMPRKRPPFPAQAGLWSKPTTVDNVETLSHLRAILERGPDWFKSQGTEKAGGHTLYGISGAVKKPGIYELPYGTRLRDLIFKYAGGLEDGRSLKAIIPGGISMPVLKPEQIDVAMDPDSVRTVGTMLGTAGVIVMDDRACPVRAALIIGKFFEHESCGQCTQCREGTGWIYKTLKRVENGEGTAQDMETIAGCCEFMDGKTICALSDASAMSTRAFIKQFRGDFEAHIHEHRCPFPESFEV